MPRLIHCCYADKWPQRIGGVAAVSMVVQKLPMAWLQSHLPDVIKAALAVLKHLPRHASLEQAQLLKSLTTIMHLLIPQVRLAISCCMLVMNAAYIALELYIHDCGSGCLDATTTFGTAGVLPLHH